MPHPETRNVGNGVVHGYAPEKEWIYLPRSPGEVKTTGGLEFFFRKRLLFFKLRYPKDGPKAQGSNGEKPLTGGGGFFRIYKEIPVFFDFETRNLLAGIPQKRRGGLKFFAPFSIG